MSQSGPIIIVEDDMDDQETTREAIKELEIKNELIFFDRSSKAFDFLKSTTQQPFLILSDVNLPVQNGIDFKRQIDEDHYLKRKSIPFIFYSTAADKYAVDTAYKDLTVQGFFKKNNRYDELKHDLKVIFDYWNTCKHPNSWL